MKQPIFMISTEGKTREQIKSEAREAYLAYLQANGEDLPEE